MNAPVMDFRDRGEWLKARRDGLGASDAPAVLGVSPWKSNVRLWEEKTGIRLAEDISLKPFVKYGNDAEPLLRTLFALDNPQYEVSFTPFRIMRSQKAPYLFATPDGELLEMATGRRGGLEIKTTEIRNAAGWVKWKDRIPDEYYVQVLHQFLSTGWEFVELLAQIKHTTMGGEARKDTRQYHIELADVLGDMELVERENRAFWRCVQEKRRPNLKLPTI